VKETTFDTLVTVLAVVIAALGFSVGVPDFIGGLGLSIGLGLLARLHMPLQSRRGTFATIVSAVFTGLLFALIAKLYGLAPFQLSMAVGGLTSALVLPTVLLFLMGIREEASSAGAGVVSILLGRLRGGRAK
jgi:hypothetical protein